MDKLIAFLNKMDRVSRDKFCVACGTTESYLRKAASVQQRLRAELCIDIERESEGHVKCEDLRPDVDWAYLRSSAVEE